jgi:3-oxoacyl-[acyl-carrier protein] reductase
MRLKDKITIVTGSGRGIGRATALRFAEEGSKIVVVDVDHDETQTVVDEIDATGGQGAGGRVKPAFGERHGSGHLGPLWRADRRADQQCRRHSRRSTGQNDRAEFRPGDLKGVFNCTQAVAPTMIAQGSGVILSTSSLVAPYGNYGQTNYVASKAGVVGMTKVWARELGRKGIRANAVAPGFIETRMTAGIPQNVVDKMLERIAMGRFGKPEDIANCFLWLASDEARYVSGQVIGVDGGATL